MKFTSINFTRAADKLRVEMLRAFLLLLHLQHVTKWPATVSPLFMSRASSRSVPCSKWTVTASNPQMLCFTHLLLGPPPKCGSLGTDKLCLGKSGLMGAGRLHAADPTPASGLGNKLKSMCLSGKGNSTFPWTLVWRKSQHGTECGLAWSECSEGRSVNMEVSGISQIWEDDINIIKSQMKAEKKMLEKKGGEIKVRI